ncbi:hypothetical protein RD110_10690 [Rhodoferax koreense]|uniref:Uncharacterized protein n=1 Tax=Rhodoferax koreensis TaxID=1842727 RepID=A0A1P8JV03_9BURK|nr:hypothetical protein [Rhodoferax koreense]APW37596.1 hypothetical protein RD110_10690 [Rhodoferax koreense]
MDEASLSTPLPNGRFEGRAAFQQLLRDALCQAAHQGWREITVCDSNFEDWPLGERAVVDALQAWAGSGRKWTMLADSFDAVTRRHPRFVNWRRTWSHLIDCRAVPGHARRADPSSLPSCLIGPSWVMRRLDLEHCTGISGDEPRRRVDLQESLNEWLRRSSPAFPATVLGL